MLPPFIPVQKRRKAVLPVTKFFHGWTVNIYPLSGKWLENAGFIDGMPVKIRVMKDCIVITPQHTRELWGCLEGMSVVNINKKKVAQWLKTFPGALNDLGDVPVIKRDK